MKYVSIDLETTGLDPSTCDILEFAAVVDDTLKPEVPVDQLPSFRALVVAKSYRGEPYALAMHPELFREIASADKLLPYNAERAFVRSHSWALAPGDLFTLFEQWAVEVGVLGPERKGKILVAGKNFAGFDLRFLRENNGVMWDRTFSHRVLDPAMLFTLAEDDKPPSLELCLERAGFTKTVSHRALDDARDVVRCIRSGLSRVRELSESKRTELERRLASALVDKQAAEQLLHQRLSQAVSQATKRSYELMEEMRRTVTVAESAQRAAEYEVTRVLKQVDTLKRQVVTLTDGSAQRRLAHLGNWQAWAEMRMVELEGHIIGDSGRADWDKANPEPTPPPDDASGGEGA